MKLNRRPNVLHPHATHIRIAHVIHEQHDDVGRRVGCCRRFSDGGNTDADSQNWNDRPKNVA